MKAKEHIKLIMEASETNDKGKIDKALYEMLTSLIAEMADIADKRGGTSNSLTGACREIENKYQSIASKIPFMKKDGFRVTMKNDHPTLFNVMGWS